MKKDRIFSVPDILRYGILGWLLAVVMEYGGLPKEARGLEKLDAFLLMELPHVLMITAAITCVLLLLRMIAKLVMQSTAFGFSVPEEAAHAVSFLGGKVESVVMVFLFAVLAVLSLQASYTLAFLCACALVLLILVFYAIFGWDESREPVGKKEKDNPIWLCLTAALSIVFFLFVSIWTVSRVNSFCTPSFDFGIFSQMFYNMKESGLPMTTVERDGLLSHFDVHMSPIYYLMLPFYCIVPTPATLQVLQAAVITSAVIPLWLIGRNRGLSSLQRMLLCTILLLYPAFSGATSYDIHENCFLTPLLLWLLYGIDKKNIPITAVAAVLTLTVKEDAAVYVGIVAVYLLLRTALRFQKGDWWGIIAGGSMLIGALAYFFAVTGYLAENGDGVMTYRYDNFIYDDSGSLITVIKAVLMNPMKALFECVDEEKLKFIAQTMVPLLGLPLLTRRFERYILLIPYVLINLMSDYQYQHDIMFQYTFGSTACLLYLVAVNLADLKIAWMRLAALAAAVAVCFGFFNSLIVPVAKTYPEYCEKYAGYYDEVRQVLDTVPEGASVTATTFYTTYLSQREVLYDIMYCSREHLLSTEYVVLNVTSSSNYKKYGGFENVVRLLEQNGYTLYAQRKGTVVIYQKPQT